MYPINIIALFAHLPSRSLTALTLCVLLSACSNFPLNKILNPTTQQEPTAVNTKKAETIEAINAQQSIDSSENSRQPEPDNSTATVKTTQTDKIKNTTEDKSTTESLTSSATPKTRTGTQRQQTIKVLDINTGTKSSDPAQLIQSGEYIYFSADDGIHGTELWQSDKTGTTIKLIKDINTTPVKPDSNTNKSAIWTDNAFPSSLTGKNGLVFFAATDGQHGKELWRSNGTASGTYLVKDIAPQANGMINSSHPAYLTLINDTLFFSADDGIHGKELWRSDGTKENTVMVKDINTTDGNASPTHLTNINGTLYFSANDGINGYELWKSDGTEAGTAIVKNINQSDNAFPSAFTELNGKVYFIADDGVYGKELWRSDGTDVGTVMVKDINTSQGVNDGKAIVSELYRFGDHLYFAANDAINGTELWQSDGTTAGTMMIKDINPGLDDATPAKFTQLKSTLFFATNDGNHGIELWKSDGTSAGTVLVKDINTNTGVKSGNSYPTALTATADRLFFVADDGSGRGEELWVSDGTTPGTKLFYDISLDINTNAGGSNPRDLAYIDKTLFFSAFRKNIGRELFSIGTDSTLQPQ